MIWTLITLITFKTLILEARTLLERLETIYSTLKSMATKSQALDCLCGADRHGSALLATAHAFHEVPIKFHPSKLVILNPLLNPCL